MSGHAISVRDLGKRYRLGRREPYRALGETLTRAVKSVFARSAAARDDGPANLWALRGVSFDIPVGEVVGIIGLNGAGKSTLLKILSRITVPSEGEASIHGRVGSLLEVGTGFHPELTGLENVYLNGAILGMRRAEITGKVEDIVAFAEVERFVDTPIKHYSSGMYMRLAFAVAAHLDFEILLVDEVLAVGDLMFQRKCLAKMRDVGQDGRTVLFVSHNMGAIGMLTKRCLWIDQGRLVDDGLTEGVVQRFSSNPFLHRGAAPETVRGISDLTLPSFRQGLKKAVTRDVTFSAIRLEGKDGEPRDTFHEGEPITVDLTLDVGVDVRAIDVLCRVRRADGYLIFTALTGKRSVDLRPGRYAVRCVFDPNHLRPGWYYIELSAVTGAAVAQDAVPEAIAFNVLAHGDADDDPRYAREQMGVIRVDYPWTDFSQGPPERAR